MNLEDAVGDKGFCLVKDQSDKTLLNRNHSYYYQVQAQINTVDTAEYCDFLVWNENDIIIERIVGDQDLWETIIQKAEYFLGSVFSQ